VTVPEETSEVEETEEEVEETEETESEQSVSDADKLRKALGRERNARRKALSDLAELRKQSQQGDPNKGEMEKLTEQVAKLQKSIATKDRVTSLLEAGFNQSSEKAERMLRMIDNFDDEEWIEELKVDYPQQFGKQKTPAGERPHTGSGRSNTGGESKDANTRHAEKLLRMGRR